MDMCKGFQPNGLLAIGIVFAVCLKLVLFYVFIVYFWSSVPSKALEIPQVLKDLTTISWGISAHAIREVRSLKWPVTINNFALGL